MRNFRRATEVTAELWQFSEQTRLECLSNYRQTLVSCRVLVAQSDDSMYGFNSFSDTTLCASCFLCDHYFITLIVANLVLRYLEREDEFSFVTETA